MNKRQQQRAGVGCVSTALLMSLDTSRLHPPVAGPVVEAGLGRYSASFTDAIVPLWALLASLGVVVLTVAFPYHSQKDAR